MMLLVVFVIIGSVLLFSLLFLYLFRVYKSLQTRHQKPDLSSNAIPLGLEQHQDLAFVLAHGVEAYNEQRRLRQQQARAQARTVTTTAADPAGSINTPGVSANDLDDDRASTQSSQPSITPLPPYSPDPLNGDIGFGWRTAGPPGLFEAPAITGDMDNPAYSYSYSRSHTAGGAAAAATYPLDNLPPPMYIYQPPSTRSTVQAALLTTDNSPSVAVPTSSSTSGAVQPLASLRADRRGGRRRSVVSGILSRSGRGTTQRSMSVASTGSSSSSAVGSPSDTAPAHDTVRTEALPPSTDMTLTTVSLS